MSPSLMPFLYQTRTLQRVWRAPVNLRFAKVQVARSCRRGYAKSSKDDNSIPFDWGDEAPPESFKKGWRDSGDQDSAAIPSSTITPTEAHVFKGIFDEIAQGKMPSTSTKRRPLQGGGGASEREVEPLAGLRSTSIVEQARMNEFRDNVLSRFPEDLRNAAHVALGLFETKSGSEFIEVEQESEEQRLERLKYERIREEEKTRVDELMKACDTDFALWRVMEKEVFSLPQKLGIVTAQEAADETVGGASSNLGAEEEQKRVMDVHGPLYSHFLNQGLALFDSGFARPSSLALEILPRVKALGLPSYVLGVSTPFYAALARIHWDRFGDASTALDVIDEMNKIGLFANEDVQDLLYRMRSDIYVCSLGSQGSFVTAMMEAPPFDGALLERLDDLARMAEHSLSRSDGDYSY